MRAAQRGLAGTELGLAVAKLDDRLAAQDEEELIVSSVPVDTAERLSRFSERWANGRIRRLSRIAGGRARDGPRRFLRPAAPGEQSRLAGGNPQKGQKSNCSFPMHRAPEPPVGANVLRTESIAPRHRPGNQRLKAGEQARGTLKAGLARGTGSPSRISPKPRLAARTLAASSPVDAELSGEVRRAAGSTKFRPCRRARTRAI